MKLEVCLDLNEWVRVCVRDEILAQNNYCYKPNPKYDSHSSSRVWNGIGYQAVWSTLEYDLATTIAIRLLTQPVMCEMGSSIFFAMTQLKVASTTSASLTIIPYNDSKNWEKWLLC